MNVEIVNFLKPTKMSACPNCGNKLSCGCQRRKASDGTTVCSTCLQSYERKLKPEKKEPISKPAPTVWGKNRYNNLNKFVK